LSEGGNITLALPASFTANVAWFDASGNPLGAPEPLVTMTQLAALQASMTAAIAATQAQLTAQITQVTAALLANTNALSAQISQVSASLVASTGTINGEISQLSSSIASTNAAVGAANSSLMAQIAQVKAQDITSATDLLTRLSITNNNVNALSVTVQTNLTTLTQALAVQLNNNVSTLQAAIATKVDVGNLPVIAPFIVTTVNGMVAAGQTNDLAVQLSSKLTNSPTCSCFNPTPFSALQSTVSSLVTSSNYTLSCHAQGLVFNQTAGICTYPVPQASCGALIPSLSIRATSACGLTAGSTLSGATCFATCNTGYSGGTTGLFTCDSSGIWRGSLSCPADPCPTLVAPVNGAISSATGTTGALVNYTCNSGYLLSGSASTTCLIGRTWSSAAPICYAACSTLTAPANGNVLLPSSLSVGNAAHYSCNTGYVLDGTAASVCLQNGAWTTSAPVCQVPCIYSAPGNGTVTAPVNVVAGSIIKFACNVGYSLTGSSTTNCRSNGQWTDPFATCTPLPCVPLSVANALVSPSINGVTLDFRTIACNSGYIMVGQSTSTCQTSGLWTQVPSCTLVACPTNAAGAPACTCNSGYAGSLTFSGATWAGTCSLVSCPANSAGAPSCACSSGYSGTLTFSGGAYSGSCSLAACPSFAAGAPSCACSRGYSGTLSWAGGAYSGSCSLASCPANAAGAPACACSSGYSGSLSWTGSVWTGTCSLVACPGGAAGAPSCACSSGYSGSLSWTGSAYSGSCSLVACPANAAGAPSCACSSGFTGTVSWTGSAWSGTCTASQFCASTGYSSCPTGRTQWCKSSPISSTSESDALLACQACFTSCPFHSGSNDCAGPGYAPSSNSGPHWGWTSGCSGGPGRVWNYGNSYTTYGNWA